MIETLEKEVKSDDQRFSMSNTRKADLLFSIKKDLEIIEGDISKYTTPLESVLLIIASQGCSSPLRRLTKKTIKILLNKVKSTKIMNILQDYLKITQSLRYSALAKATCFDIIGFIYSEFSSKLLSPPTEELLESAIKLYKNCENSLKKFIIKAVNAVIKSRTGNLSPLVSEYYKFLSKVSAVIAI